MAMNTETNWKLSIHTGTDGTETSLSTQVLKAN
jgi:hypothetical protein